MSRFVLVVSISFYVLSNFISISSAFSPVTGTRFRMNKITMTTTEDNVGENSSTETNVAVRCPNCDKCDGSGRILGGIPTVLPWWPIKPYRPCPNFIANGGQYSRIGQPLDEIAFGRGGSIDDEDEDF